MTKYILDHAIKLAVLIVAGIGYVIYRKVIAANDKSYVDGLIKKLRNYNITAEQVAESLDIPYGKRENASQEEFLKLTSALKSAVQIDTFTILYQATMGDFQHLLITEVAYDDFDIGITGEPTDVAKKAYHSFVIKFEPNQNILSVWSELYTDTTSKFQKEAFSRGVTMIS